MAKTRLYELAKELGLDNKRILDLCTELGIDGKTSHSNSLSDDEADKIRRSVIRQAVSGTAKKKKDITIDGRPGVEQRKGNIIRRRKKDGEGAEAELDLSAEEASDDGDEVHGTEDHRHLADDIFATKTDEATPAAESQTVAQADEQEAVELLDDDDPLEETRRKHGARAPKVLGKIALPQREIPSPKAGIETVPGGEESAAASSARKAKKKKFGATVENFSDDKPRRKARKQVLRKADLLDYDSERDTWRGRKDGKSKKAKVVQPQVGEQKLSKKVVKIDGEISVGEVARQMSVKVGDLVKTLMNLGVMATINQLIDFETATIVAAEFGFTTVNKGHDEDEYLAKLKLEGNPERLEFRPPIVTVMGHVDHGKTSLLDVIRKSSVTATESGGITQHIGAYNVKVASGGSVTFIDTPGHEAFTSMRSRGAKLTDIVVLVVAADDGVMPQTIEAINHAKAAEVPIIVAINKVDKEQANIERIRTQLAEHELIPEEWGGKTIMVSVSAKTKQGIDELLENLQVQSEIMELKADPSRDAYGTVIEAKLDKGRGPVVTVLVQNGTLKVGDIFLCGSVTGKVRALISSSGEKVTEAGPGIPVEVLGASETPDAGSEFLVLKTEAEARSVAQHRAQRERSKHLLLKGGVSGAAPLSLERFSELVLEGTLKELPIIVKADVGGSVEAVRDSIIQLSNQEVTLRVIHAAVGAVSESDINLAAASGAIIVGFNVRIDTRARDEAERVGVDVRFFTIIYELIESLDKAIKGMLAPIIKERTLGRAEVRQTFRVPKLGTVAGSYVLDGVIERGARVRLLRDNRVVYEGKMASLRRFKDDTKEVQSGYECGIGIEGYSDIKDGDIIEAFKLEETRPE